MVECKKCGTLFEPQKGLTNYCSLSCRNSRERSEEVKEKIRKSSKGKKHSAETKLKIRNSNLKRGKEIKNQISSSLKKYFENNPEARANISKHKVGKTFITAEGRAKLRRLAIERELGGLNSKKKFFYKGVYLQSSYEYRLAVILDELNIKWERPKPLTYFLEKEKKYYADFYLLDFSIYIDTKNSYLAVKDKPKIDTVSKQNDVTVLILLEEHLTKEYIQAVIV